MKMPGYDTFGPQYPPEWDEVDTIVCGICGDRVPDDYVISLLGQDNVCPDCVYKIEEKLDMRFYGKKIRKFELYEPIELVDTSFWREWEGPNEDNPIVDPGVFELKSIYINAEGDIGFNYGNEDTPGFDEPELDIKDLLALEKQGILKFIEEDK